MTERLKLNPEKVAVAQKRIPQEAGARAVVLCGGCPMAQFCAKKMAAPCESPIEQRVVIDAGSDVASAPQSYRTKLLDDSINTVMARLTPKPTLPPKTPLKVPPKQPPKPAPKTPPSPQPKPIRISKPSARKPHRAPKRRGEPLGEIIADMFAVALGVRAVDAATKR